MGKVGNLVFWMRVASRFSGDLLKQELHCPVVDAFVIGVKHPLHRGSSLTVSEASFALQYPRGGVSTPTLLQCFLSAVEDTPKSFAISVAGLV